jgi:hypothetical protein
MFVSVSEPSALPGLTAFATRRDSAPLEYQYHRVAALGAPRPRSTCVAVGSQMHRYQLGMICRWLKKENLRAIERGLQSNA